MPGRSFSIAPTARAQGTRGIACFLVPAATPGLRFVAPYPASLIKLMVVVGIAQLVCQGSLAWHERWTHAGETRRVADWCEPMITVSSNEATTALVALLHERGMIRRELHTEPQPSPDS